MKLYAAKLLKLTEDPMSNMNALMYIRHAYGEPYTDDNGLSYWRVPAEDVFDLFTHASDSSLPS